MKEQVFQTQDNKITIAVITDEDGSVAVGIARAGKTDSKRRLVTSKKGVDIALERARKARTRKESLCDKNYLRGFYGKIVEGTGYGLND